LAARYAAAAAPTTVKTNALGNPAPITATDASAVISAGASAATSTGLAAGTTADVQ
jgi:hypothetical protein